MRKKLFYSVTTAALLFSSLSFAGNDKNPRMLDDRDGNGVVTQKEMQKNIEEIFEHRDQNNDGFISQEEIKNPQKAKKKLGKRDQNQDGKVSRAEALSKANERFSKLDADKNGQITPEEIKNWRTPHQNKL